MKETTTRIYALRDRLVDYYMPPFLGPNDKAVLASLANLVNSGEVTNAVYQAPHHFEVWRLGEIQDDGHITANKEFLGDCNTLIRPGVREARESGARQVQGPTGASTSSPGGVQHHHRTKGGDPAYAPQEPPGATPQARPGSGGAETSPSP